MIKKTPNPLQFFFYIFMHSSTLFHFTKAYYGFILIFQNLKLLHKAAVSAEGLTSLEGQADGTQEVGLRAKKIGNCCQKVIGTGKQPLL